MRRRVVISGMGTVNPLGNSVDETWANVKNNVCGIKPITRVDGESIGIHLAGEVKNLDIEGIIGPKEARRMDRFTQFAVIAAKEAMIDSGLDISNEAAARCGVIVSSGVGGLGTIEHEHSRGLERGFNKISPFFIPMTISNMAAGLIAIEHGFKGMCFSVVTACAGGNNAIGEAFKNIRDGYADVMLCGGAEGCITELGVGGFASMKALNNTYDETRASIPFDKERKGFVIGEGSGILILEEYEHAVNRGAKIYAEIAGYGTNCDAYHMTAPKPDGTGAAECIRLALEDAKLKPENIDYINAHGTSTSLNDKCETIAIHTIFGEHANKLMVSSTKSMTGHLLGASGAVEAIFTALALKEGFVPATINYQVPDEECDLDIVPNKGRNADINIAMSNALGFGGHNASIIISKM